MKLKLNTILAIFIAITTISSGCKSDSQPKDTDTTLDIRLREDPAKLNPIIQNTSVARLVHQYIFLPLCDHHPETKQLYPILLQEMPKLLADPDRVSYEMSIREEATWDNGRSIDANDFLFTMKLIMVLVSMRVDLEGHLKMFLILKLILLILKHLRFILLKRIRNYWKMPSPILFSQGIFMIPIIFFLIFHTRV